MTHVRTWPATGAGTPSPSASSPSPPAAVSPWRQRRAAIGRRAADYQSAGARRRVQLVLGLIWLLDAALLTLHQPAAFNALFATVQLAIGLGLLWRRTARAALAGSIIWGLSIWWLGEGLGGILAAGASPVTGAPGGAVLSALIAAAAWPERPALLEAASVAAGSILAGRWARLAWLALWGSGAYFLIPAPGRAPGALRGVLAGRAAGEPGWIAALPRGAAAAIGPHSTAVSFVLAVVFAVIAVGVFVPAVTRPVLVLAALTAAVIWVLGENLGQLLTGQATNPGTGPLLVLLATAYWPCAAPSRLPAWHRPRRPYQGALASMQSAVTVTARSAGADRPAAGRAS
jgi:hypothetical protein